MVAVEGSVLCAFLCSVQPFLLCVGKLQGAKAEVLLSAAPHHLGVTTCMLTNCTGGF